jgi:hypothetical protein
MNQPLVSFQLKDKFLLVIGHGKRDNFSSMAEASALIYDKILETKIQYLLVDYTKLEINVNLTEAFNIIKRYESILPGLKNTLIAAAFDSRGLPFANYWKEVGEKRGFTIKIFDDIGIAEQWLLSKIEGS